MTQADLLAEVATELIGLNVEFNEDLYNQAYEDASSETNFYCPLTDTLKIKWLKARVKRWLFVYKLDSAVENFNVPKADLNQIFTNYKQRVKDMDEEYMLAKLENPITFGISTTQGGMFGTVVGSGFVNDVITGEDLSYESTGNVKINRE
jgi:hypothetical protein